MPHLVVVLTECALAAVDAEQIVALHARDDERPAYRVLVPQDTDRNLLADVLDHLSLLELRAAVAELRHQPSEREARHTAAERLDTSLTALREAGVDAEGEVTADDPLPALRAQVERVGADEVVVVTRPHAVEDTLHTDWASVARDTLGVPVLHVYAGTSFLG